MIDGELFINWQVGSKSLKSIHRDLVGWVTNANHFMDGQEVANFNTVGSISVRKQLIYCKVRA